MGKIRIYDLARELGIKNKELVEKAKELNMKVKSHSSSVEEEEAALLKAAVLGTAKQEIVEKKIRPGVIRRRRVVVVTEPLEPEPVPVPKPVEDVVPPEKEEPPVEPEVVPDAAAAEPPGEEPVEPPELKAEIPEPEPAPAPAPPAEEPPAPEPAVPEEKAPAKPAVVEEKKKRKVEKEARPPKPSKRKKVIERADIYGKGTRPHYVPGKHKRAPKAARKKAAAPVAPPAPPKAIKRRIKLDEAITVMALSKRMGVKASEVIKKLMDLGVMATINQALDYDSATLVAADFGFDVEKVTFDDQEILKEELDRTEDLVPRSPVVTVMGHVDHGKTSLLDAIRKTSVADGEAGGITQHIGAYHVKTDKGEISFIDTPGHAAFTAMRSRGAQVTDLVVLVVAADDGVMEQTREAINHARAAKVPILVAINKIDKPNANVPKVISRLSELDLTPEEWGGDTTVVEVSAKEGTGIDDLLDLIVLQGELMELKANPNKKARGYIVEARLDKGRGPVATVLINEGTLKKGDSFVCGLQYGRVRAMFDDKKLPLIAGGPSMPVEVQGISGVPEAGDQFVVVEQEKTAKQVAQFRQARRREKEVAQIFKPAAQILDEMGDAETKELSIVIKGDVQGTVEAVSDSLRKLATREVKVNILHSGTGGITESDVYLSSASDAVIIGFNVRGDAKSQGLAQREGVQILYHNVIYEAVEEIKSILLGLHAPKFEEHVLGRAEVRKVFRLSTAGIVAGCYVMEGNMERGANVRVIRDAVVVYDSRVASLRHFQDDVKTVRAGMECGVTIENYQDVKEGDVLEAYQLEELEPILVPETEH